MGIGSTGKRMDVWKGTIPPEIGKEMLAIVVVSFSNAEVKIIPS